MPLNEKLIKAAVIGGDARQIFIANELAEMGYEVSAFALGGQCISCLSGKVSLKASLDEALKGADFSILPIPFSKDSLTLNAPYFPKKIALCDTVSSLSSCPCIALGMPSESVKEALSARSRVIDYAKDEGFLLKNAQASAEGALAVIIESIPTTVSSSLCAIVGYGRISRYLASYLASLGARVRIFARKESDRASARCCGYESFDTCCIGEMVSDVDALINTAPAVIITKDAICRVKKDARLIELASAPGGFDRDTSKETSREIISAQSLPAKFSPKSAARIVLESVLPSLPKEVRL